ATSSRYVATRRSKFCELWGLKYHLTQTDECENSNKENNLIVANPPITKYKSKPRTKRYKAATEKS
ncbi:27240_t:CDS:2, partial [Racocetra persica]